MASQSCYECWTRLTYFPTLSIFSTKISFYLIVLVKKIFEGPPLSWSANERNGGSWRVIDFRRVYRVRWAVGDTGALFWQGGRPGGKVGSVMYFFERALLSISPHCWQTDSLYSIRTPFTMDGLRSPPAILPSFKPLWPLFLREKNIEVYQYLQNLKLIKYFLVLTKFWPWYAEVDFHTSWINFFMKFSWKDAPHTHTIESSAVFTWSVYTRYM